MKTYQVIVRPGEKYWILEIPGIGFTQARTTAEIESMARDLITVMTQDADFALTIETKLPQSVQEHLDEARRLRKEEAECRSNAARETRAAAQELHGMGLALQQIGDILGGLTATGTSTCQCCQCLASIGYPHNAITAETRLAPLSRDCCASMPETPSISATFPGKWRAKSVRRVAR